MPRTFWLVCALLSVMCALLASSVWYKTLCYDEQAHWDYGRRVLASDSRRLQVMDDSKMPLSALNAAAWPLLGELGLQTSLLPAYDDLPAEERARTIQAKRTQLAVKTGRAVTILATLLFGLLIFFWCRDLYGPRAALLSLGLYVLSPNILAHGRFVTTDIYGMGCIVLAGYAFWRFCMRPGAGRSALAGASLGLAQLAKFSSAYLIIIDVLLLVPFVPHTLRTLRAGGFAGVRAALIQLLLFAGSALFVLNAGFLFQGTLRPLDSYSFESGLFRNLQKESGLLGQIPLPLPSAFLSGLDMVKAHEQSGQTFGQLYLRGKLKNLSEGRGGFKNYYLWASLYKFPLPLLLLSVLALFWSCRSGHADFWKREWFLFCPAAVYLLILNFYNNAQIGIRHLLVISPFVLIFCGSLLRAEDSPKGRAFRIRQAAVALLLIWQVVSVGSYFPHFVSYFNELSWDRKNNWRLLADSNLEWGQNRRYLERFFRTHPNARLNPEERCCGLVVVDSNLLTGVLAPKEKYAWLRNEYQPTDHVAYGYIVYEIPAKDCAGGAKK